MDQEDPTYDNQGGAGAIPDPPNEPDWREGGAYAIPDPSNEPLPDPTHWIEGGAYAIEEWSNKPLDDPTYRREGAIPKRSNLLQPLEKDSHRPQVALNRAPVLPGLAGGRRHSGPPQKPGAIEAACCNCFVRSILPAAKAIDTQIEQLLNAGKTDASEAAPENIYGLASHLEEGIRNRAQSLLKAQDVEQVTNCLEVRLRGSASFQKHLKAFIKSLVVAELRKIEALEAFKSEKEQLLQLVRRKHHVEAFEKALSSDDHRFLNAVCWASSKLDFVTLQPNPFSPSLTAAIIHRLSKDFRKEKVPPLKFFRYLVHKLTKMALDEEEKQRIAEQLKESRIILSDIMGNAPEEARPDQKLEQIIVMLGAFIG
ncbi:uncharacterized protein LOC130915302 [Corythoichthys intestinalis]|uniref:uncharacterized protein LOC130915302 n=1 Tax=Corythoichthys intestinalis TaxID=161448 RepID=UPI0025A549FF|nr:uncharacterized protein LOC130915302 [Corythoichthys intestinalis]